MKHTGPAAIARCALLMAFLSLAYFSPIQASGGSGSNTQLQATLKAERGYYGDFRLELISFHLMNHSNESLNTAESSWELIIDGKPATNSGGQLWMGPRPAEDYGTLAPGRDFRFGKALAVREYFPEPRDYAVSWKAAGFRSNTVIVRGGIASQR